MAELKATPLLKPNGQPTGKALCPICNAVIGADDNYKNHHSPDDDRLKGGVDDDVHAAAVGLLHPELLSQPVQSNHPEMTPEQLSVLNMEVPTSDDSAPKPSKAKDKDKDDDDKDDDK